MDTPYRNVDTLFRSSFDLFLKDLRHIQKLDYQDTGTSVNSVGGSISTSISNTNSVSKEQTTHEHRNSFLSKLQRSNCDIDSFVVEVIIKKSSETNLSFETDESYNVTTSCE